MKDFAKSIVCNIKVGNELTSYDKAKKSDLEKRLKKEEQLLEDAKKMLRSKLSDDDRIGFQIQKEDCEKNVSRLKEEIRKIGNSKVGNAKDKNGNELRIGDVVAVKTSDPSLNHGKIVRISGDQVSVDVTGDDDIWTTPARLTVKMGNQKTGNSRVGNLSHTKEEAKTKDEYFKILKFYQTQGYKTNAGEYNPNGRIKLHKGDDSVEIVLVGNSKVGNASGTYNKLETEIRYAISEASVASKILSGNFSATNIISALSHCKQCCDNAIKLAQEYDRELNK